MRFHRQYVPRCEIPFPYEPPLKTYLLSLADCYVWLLQRNYHNMACNIITNKKNSLSAVAYERNVTGSQFFKQNVCNTKDYSSANWIILCMQ